MTAEQRKFPRSVLDEETIYFMHADKSSSAQRIYSPATITNISRGGVGMKVGIPHELDDELWLEGIEGFSGAQSARVKWIKGSDNKMFEIGAEFEGVRS